MLSTNSVQTDLALFMPPEKPQPFLYDLNGNLTNDGYRVYTWDEENRLIAIETTPASVATGIERRRSEYLYDAQWRRVLTIDLAAWDGTSYTSTNTTRFVWDGWNLFAEIIENQQSTITNYYIWGLDLSQTLQGAGGIGGLLAVYKGGAGVPPAIYFPVCEGNQQAVIDQAWRGCYNRLAPSNVRLGVERALQNLGVSGVNVTQGTDLKANMPADILDTFDAVRRYSPCYPGMFDP